MQNKTKGHRIKRLGSKINSRGRIFLIKSLTYYSLTVDMPLTPSFHIPNYNVIYPTRPPYSFSNNFHPLLL